MIINVLISTLDEGIHRVPEIFLKPQEGIRYTIIHQISEPKFFYTDSFNRADVKLISTPGRGLSKSRNLAINYAKGDIAILADDDVKYTEQYFQTIFDTYQTHPELDVACFKIKTGEREPEYKPYFSTSVLIESNPPHFISSIETTFRIASIQRNMVCFDERFGLGSGTFSSGEETIFIYDCLKKGLNIRYFPHYIVEHTFESSGKSISKEKYITVGAVYARIKGCRSLGITFRKFISKLPNVLHVRNNPFIYLFYTLKGNFKILLAKKVR